MINEVTPHDAGRAFVSFVYNSIKPIELAMVLDSVIFKLVKYKLTDEDYEGDTFGNDEISILKDLRDICLGINSTYNNVKTKTNQ